MEQQQAPESVVALYSNLAETQAAMQELEQAGVPYPDIRMGAHALSDPELPVVDNQGLPDQFWSLTVIIDQPGVYHSEDILRKHQPLAVGRMPAPQSGRSDTDLGAIAWRHYVFESSAAADWAGETAGATGNTGVGSSGAFATDALAEGNPPVRNADGSDGRSASEEQRPSSDDRKPGVSTDRSRPDNTLHE